MGILDWIEAIIKLGAPMTVSSWLMFSWLFTSGKIDREARFNSVSTKLKKVNKKIQKSDNRHATYVFRKWTSFGSGFYGLAAFWTFLVIEISDFLGFINSFSFASMFSEGLLSFIVSLLVNQLGNFIQAAVWFSYWPSDDQSILVWLGIAYLGYWAGVELARRNLVWPRVK